MEIKISPYFLKLNPFTGWYLLINRIFHHLGKIFKNDYDFI